MKSAVFIQFLKAGISEVQRNLYLFCSELTYLLFVLLLLSYCVFYHPCYKIRCYFKVCLGGLSLQCIQFKRFHDLE